MWTSRRYLGASGRLEVLPACWLDRCVARRLRRIRLTPTTPRWRAEPLIPSQRAAGSRPTEPPPGWNQVRRSHRSLPPNLPPTADFCGLTPTDIERVLDRPVASRWPHQTRTPENDRQKRAINTYLSYSYGGRGGIRTHGGLTPTAVFKTAALNHSATRPGHPRVSVLMALIEAARKEAAGYGGAEAAKETAPKGRLSFKLFHEFRSDIDRMVAAWPCQYLSGAFESGYADAWPEPSVVQAVYLARLYLQGGQSGR